MTQIAKIETVKRDKITKSVKIIKDQTWTKWLINSARTFADIAVIIPSVELPAISIGHQQLIERTLKTKSLIQSNLGKSIDQKSIAECRTIIVNLMEFAKTFFDYEEKLLTDLEVTTSKEHKSAHRELEYLFQQKLENIEHGRIPLKIDLYISLIDSIINHITAHDVPSYRISNLKTFLNQDLNIDKLSQVIKPSGIECIDTAIFNVSSKIALAISEKQTDIEIFKKDILSSLKEYIATEEQFLKETNNIHSFSMQQEEHSELIEITEMATSLTDIKALLQQWLYHINLLDFQTHNFKNWSKISLQVAEEIDDFEMILKTCGHKIVGSYHHDILEFILESGVLSETEKTNESGLNFVEKLDGKIRALFGIEKDILTFLEVHEFFKVCHLFEHQKILDLIEFLKKMTETNRYRFSQNVKVELLETLIYHFNYQDILLYGEKR